LPDCAKFTDAADGANAKVSLAFDLANGTICAAEVHWYEAAGMGRKEFKIKHLL
jgi:hypothetical protein